MYIQFCTYSLYRIMTVRRLSFSFLSIPSVRASLLYSPMCVVQLKSTVYQRIFSLLRRSSDVNTYCTPFAINESFPWKLLANWIGFLEFPRHICLQNSWLMYREGSFLSSKNLLTLWIVKCHWAAKGLKNISCTKICIVIQKMLRYFFPFLNKLF